MKEDVLLFAPIRLIRGQKLLLRRYDLFPMQSRIQRVPAKRGAFYAGGKLQNAGEDLELSQTVLILLHIQAAGHHSVEFVK